MWFWSVSWSTNWPVYFSFFWSTKENFVQYQIFFVHSLEFFVQSFLKMWFWSVSWPTNCPVNFSFLANYFQYKGEKFFLIIRTAKRILEKLYHCFPTFGRSVFLILKPISYLFPIYMAGVFYQESIRVN